MQTTKIFWRDCLLSGLFFFMAHFSLVQAGAQGPALEKIQDEQGRSILIKREVSGQAKPFILIGPTASPFMHERREDIAELDASTCTPKRLWKSTDELLVATANAGLSSVRCFTHNPWLPNEPEPFLPGYSTEAPAINPALLDKLRHFGQNAHNRGITVQIAFFDHISMRHDAFKQKSGFAKQPATPFKPWLDSIAGPKKSTDPKTISAAFFHHKNPDGSLNSIGKLQRLWIHSIIEAMPQAIVVYELINEPRWRNNPHTSREELLEWLDWAAGEVRAAEQDLGLPRHIIAISPDPHGLKEGAGVVREDLLTWKKLQQKGLLEHYDDIDMVVLHGEPFMGLPGAPQEATSAMVGSMADFFENFPEFVWMVSSDGLNGPRHWARGTSCEASDRSLAQVRHGFFNLSGPVLKTEDSSPHAWTEAILGMSQKIGGGRLHFNNWSPAAPAIQQMGTALKTHMNR